LGKKIDEKAEVTRGQKKTGAAGKRGVKKCSREEFFLVRGVIYRIRKGGKGLRQGKRDHLDAKTMGAGFGWRRRQFREGKRGQTGLNGKSADKLNELGGERLKSPTSRRGC